VFWYVAIFPYIYFVCVYTAAWLRGSHHIHVAANTDTLFTLYEPAQILRQVERATKVFSQYPPSHGERGVEIELGDVRTRKDRRFAIQQCARQERRRRKKGRGVDDTMRKRVWAKGIRALRTSLQTLGGNVHACYYIPRLNRKLSSQTSSGEARCAITLASFKLLSRRVTYVTARLFVIRKSAETAEILLACALRWFLICIRCLRVFSI